MEKLFVIDAVNYLFRSYYGIGAMTNHEGQSTSALFGFIRSVQKLRKDFSPKHLVCVFDGPNNKVIRQQIFKDYKTHREKAPDDFYPQLLLAVEYCQLAGIPYLMIDGYEADDTMASVTTWAKNKNIESYLCTSDKDLFQLVDEKTFVLHAHKNNLIIDKEKVEQIYGVRPTQILDLLALMGDSSDNIPGVSGIGPKTAAQLLQEYETLENILQQASSIKGKKGQTLVAEKEIALMSKKLATLHTDVLFSKNWDFFTPFMPDVPALKEFFKSMQFSSLLKELDPDSIKAPKTVEKGIYTLINTEKELSALCQDLKIQSEIVVDTETSFAHPLLAKLVGIGFCYQKAQAYYVPFNGNIPQKTIVEMLQPIFNDPKIGFIGHNIKFDLHVLSQHNMEIKNVIFDTMIASYLIRPEQRRHNLDQITLELFDKKKIPISSLVGEKKKRICMEDVPLEKIAEYCCEDVDYTLRAKEFFFEKLKEKNLLSVFCEYEIPLIPVLKKMEQKGIYLDTAKLKEMSCALQKELKILEEEIHREVGREFNIKSPKQLSEALYTDLGLKPSRKKGAANSTAAAVLEELSEQATVISSILEYRTLEKLRSTYTENLNQLVNPNTCRIHCTFNQSIAATGRLSCQDPNLQNIPVRTERGRKIREGFKPEKQDGYYLSFDYSQIELRLLAHFSKDPELVTAFYHDEDIHAHTASILYNVPKTQVTKKMRFSAKTVNFGVLYGQGPFGLSKQLGISNKEAKEFIDLYFKKYSKVKEYFDLCIQQAREYSFVKTITGRSRPLPEIDNKNAMIRNAAERLAVNSPLQGSNADIIKKAMILIEKEIAKKKYQGYMILQIHDELLFEVPKNEIDQFKEFVPRIMETSTKLDVPLKVNISIGKNWGEC